MCAYRIGEGEVDRFNRAARVWDGGKKGTELGESGNGQDMLLGRKQMTKEIWSRHLYFFGSVWPEGAGARAGTDRDQCPQFTHYAEALALS